MVMTADIRLFRDELHLAQRVDEGRGRQQRTVTKSCSEDMQLNPRSNILCYMTEQTVQTLHR